MPPSKKRAVIFDFDGVIADSWHLHEDCWRVLLKKLGITMSDDALAAAIGWSSKETARHLVESGEVKGDPDKLALEKDQLFSGRAAELQPMPGAVRAVKRLANDFEVTVTASRRREGVDETLTRFELTECLDALTTIDELGPEQEIDDLLKIAVKKLGVPAAKAVMVDDSRNGILAAKRIDMKAIAYTSNPTHEMDYSMADAEINTLDSLVPELINQVLAP